MINFNNINIFVASLVIEELRRNGCDFFCICPGSRSAPLTVAVAQNEKCESTVSYDERSMGFFALGRAKATRKPVGIIVTSGTAVANLLPAIIEAKQDNVPLIILSADRPSELIDTGANQTINQKNLFGINVNWYYEFIPDEGSSARHVLSSASYAYFKLLSPNQGPVHLNFAFTEPLTPIEKPFNEKFSQNIGSWLKKNQPFTKYLEPSITISQDKLKNQIAPILNRTKRGLIVIGRLSSESEIKSTVKLCERLNWPVLANITSQARCFLGENCVTHYEHLINLHSVKVFRPIIPAEPIGAYWAGILSNSRSKRFRNKCGITGTGENLHTVLDFKNNEQLKPETILHIGGRLVSKKLEEFLADCACKNYLHIDNNFKRLDPNALISHKIVAPGGQACELLAQLVSGASCLDFKKQYVVKSQELSENIGRAINNEPKLTEPFVAREVIRHSSLNNRALFLGSSMPIRDAEMFGFNFSNHIDVAANRGASGIDGIISGALGFAHGLDKPLTLFLGDLSFLHDTNGLALLKTVQVPVNIIVVNNQGGGIFSFLPIAQQKDVFSPYFDSPHEHDLSGPCQTFGVDYTKVNSKAEFIKALSDGYKSEDHQVIEAISDRRENFIFHNKLGETNEHK